jgi:hypothetical protein
MNIPLPSARPGLAQRGNAIMVVLVMCGVSALIAAAILAWAGNSTRATARSNEYTRSLAAAEAAIEKVLAHVGNDYQNYDVTLVNANLSAYRTQLPTAVESPVWSGYEFAADDGTTDRLSVDWLPQSTNTVLSSKYKGLRGFAYDLRITARARERDGRYGVWAAVQQDVELSAISPFQFAMFYNLDLEINPGPAMTVSGPVHCNGNIYTEPGTSLRFSSDVTAGKDIVAGKKPGDPNSRSPGPITFDGLRQANAFTLQMPMGALNTPNVMRETIQVPPWAEDPNSVLGRERLHNKADLVITVTDAGVAAKSGAFNNFATVVPVAQVNSFLNTTREFRDRRENKDMQTSEIDVAKFRAWNATNTVMRGVLPLGDVRSIFIADLRSQTGGTKAGVRLVNGHTLPPRGLTVATPQPLYVQGHYNVSTNGTPVNLGTPDTSQTRPAALLGDAVTVLSTSWNDANANQGLNNRVAGDTTVNAAFMAGIVQTGGGNYSGGVENFPRFLEDWSGRVFTYNGSMVVLFESQYATSPWGSGNVYSPPIRHWAFDSNFNDLAKLPPASPQLRVLLRGTWSD